MKKKKKGIERTVKIIYVIIIFTSLFKDDQQRDKKKKNLKMELTERETRFGNNQYYCEAVNFQATPTHIIQCEYFVVVFFFYLPPET